MIHAKSKHLWLVIGSIALLAITSCSQAMKKDAEVYRFYVGSGDWKLEKPIFLCELDPVNLAITVLDSFPAEGGAGYLDLSPDGRFLFATSGKSMPGEDRKNSVAAYRILEDHSLEFINRQSSQGSGLCHVQSHQDGKYVFAANYSSGHASALPVSEDGSLGEATAVVKGEGSGPNQQRQKGPHAHQVVIDPSGTFLLVPDLGTDKVMNYVFDPDNGSLQPNADQPFLAMAPGSGPRHLAFHPTKNFLYILGEMGASLTACSFEPKTGVMEVINEASIVGKEFNGNKQGAAVRMHPNGKFVYATNRDEVSSLAVFSQTSNGGIEQSQLVTGVPYWPRDFNLSPDGKFLVLAGARVDELALYTVDAQTGKVSETPARLSLPGPICIRFIH